jgi:hypothetical protein
MPRINLATQTKFSTVQYLTMKLNNGNIMILLSVLLSIVNKNLKHLIFAPTYQKCHVCKQSPMKAKKKNGGGNEN